jgi:glycosyltransferase involved in cell wall biosynthesis
VLQGANRIIVHNPSEYSLACEVLGNDRLSLIPHGVAKPPERLPQRSEFNGIRVISFGFMAPHKGFHRVIEACAILRSVGIDVRYTLQSALDVRRDDAVRYAKFCIELANSLALNDFMDFHFDFCDIDEVLERARQCDVAVLAYDDVPEGASGASRVLLRSGIPLIVSDLPVFQDLKGVCIVSKWNSPYYFAREIAHVTSSTDIWNGQAIKQYNFLASTQWSRIADMIFGRIDDY